ncbi:unnamed protein product [Polarella glacialis]|uniref:Uncharacterized protein n=1 Tax=Polarella glacialis TaxID=89957 RepID=A0A813EZ25_POLGL|nr:unnamed protein product [Polarella glacialis]
MQGDSIAAQQFCQVFQKAILAFHRCLVRHYPWAKQCVVRDVLTGAAVDTSFCTYVDDFAKVVPFQKVSDLWEKQHKIDAIYALRPHGFTSHPAKKLIVPTCKGKGANSAMKQLILTSGCALNAVYLGAVFSADDALTFELKARLQAARKAWYIFRRFGKTHN